MHYGGIVAALGWATVLLQRIGRVARIEVSDRAVSAL